MKRKISISILLIVAILVLVAAFMFPVDKITYKGGDTPHLSNRHHLSKPNNYKNPIGITVNGNIDMRIGDSPMFMDLNDSSLSLGF